MGMVIALLGIVAGSVLFHVVSPWWSTPLASNWQRMDDMLTITLLITGLFFIGINLFLVYTLLKFRHRKGAARQAAYEPDNKRLERRLIAATTLGIIALLAPGLWVYADYVRAPQDAWPVEVLGQQWQWHYRFPGVGGQFGKSDPRFVSASNPFGLDPADPAGRDNILIFGSEVHLPLHRPIKLLLRSDDVLHDFYVPEFRARMNMVPGMVTTFWFTPTRPGRYEVLCAQLCGVGHYNMRGYVVVEDEAAFRTWLQAQPTFAATQAPPPQGRAAPGTVAEPVAQGRALAQSRGCVACHSVDGRPGVGPSWQGLYGRTETLADGSTVRVDDAYLRRAIRAPQAEVVQGFAPIMPRVELSEAELGDLLAYIRSQTSPAP